MAVSERKKAKAAESKAAKKQQKQQQKAQPEEDEDDAPLPFGSRMVIIILTSFLAEKIWRYRSLVSAAWYSDTQSALEQAMITGFEYTLVMGALFFVGILVSVLTVTIQKKIFGK